MTKEISTLIHSQDILRFLKRRKKIFNLFFIFFFFLFYVPLSLKPPLFVATASFKESASKMQTPTLKALQELFSPISLESEGKAISTLSSRSFLEKVILKTGLQAEKPFSLFGKNQGCLTPFETLEYLGEKREKLLIYKKSSHSKIIIVFGGVEYLVDQGGSLHVPGLFLTLKNNLEKSFSHTYHLITIDDAIDKVLKRLKLKIRKEDSSVIDLFFLHPEKTEASFFLNLLLEEYKKSLLEKSKMLSKEQMDYLATRQQELSNQFDKTLSDYQYHLENTLGEKGFFNLKEHHQFLERKKEEGEKRKGKLLTQLSSLSLQDFFLKENFFSQEGQDIQKKLVALCREKEQLLENQKKAQEKAFSQTVVFSQLRELQEKKKFLSLGDEKNALYDLQALDLSQVKQMYQKKVEELSALLETQKKATELLLQIEHEPMVHSESGFKFLDNHIDSLLKLIADIELELLDNRFVSAKDKERATHFLHQKKNFLKQLLQKKQQKIPRQIEFLQRSCKRDQQLLCYCLDREIAFTKKELEREKNKVKKEVARELKILDKDLLEIDRNLAKLPQKWVLENKLQLEADLKVATMEGVAQLVESKHLQYHLDHTLSEILDKAHVLKKPKKFPAFLCSLLISLILVCFIGAFFLFVAVSKGFPVSLKGLSMLGYSTLSLEPGKQPKNILAERLFEKIQQKDPKIIGLALSRGPNYLESLIPFLQNIGNEVGVIYSSSLKGKAETFYKDAFQKEKIEEVQLFLEKEGDTTAFFKTEFSEKLEKLLSVTDYVFFVTNEALEAWETSFFLHKTDLIIATINEESLEAFSHYKKEKLVVIDFST